MENIYFVLFILVFAAGVGAFIGYIFIDQVRYRKEKIREVLIKTGAREIKIATLGLSTWDRMYEIYHVDYKDAQGKNRSITCWVSNLNSDLKWQYPP
jgi:hypothetical protein